MVVYLPSSNVPPFPPLPAKPKGYPEPIVSEQRSKPMNDTTRRARIKAKSPEESERWRSLADETKKRHNEGEVKDDTSSFRSEGKSVA